MVLNCLRLWILILSCSSVFAIPTNRGYSGAPGSLGRCASTCHGVNAGTVELTGFPTEYVPDSTYLLLIEAVSGLPIKNFNASVRIGTGSVTGGVITAGQNTETYAVAQENNGVHLSALDRQSGTFNWLAPGAGTGTVRLYVAAHQGARNTGPNTNLTLVATEAVVPQLPDPPTNPVPADGAEGVDEDSTTLHWSPANLADHYDVYLSDFEPLILLGSTSDTTMGNLSLGHSIDYLWRVDAVNEYGTTTGETWNFVTELFFQAGIAYNPHPSDGAMNVSVSTILSWGADFADYFDVYLGTEWPLFQYGTTSDTFLVLPDTLAFNTTYFWKVDSHNEHSVTTGESWSFTTETESDADDFPVANEFKLGAAYPNPFNGVVRVNLNVPIEAPATVKIFDRTGRSVATPLDNVRLGGTVELEWNAAGQAAGVYFLRCECGGVSSTQKLVYLP